MNYTNKFLRELDQHRRDVSVKRTNEGWFDIYVRGNKILSVSPMMRKYTYDSPYKLRDGSTIVARHIGYESAIKTIGLDLRIYKNTGYEF